MQCTNIDLNFKPMEKCLNNIYIYTYICNGICKEKPSNKFVNELKQIKFLKQNRPE